MTSPLDNGNRWAVLGVAAFMLTCVGLILDQAPALALVNESASLPKGLYTLAPAARPDRRAIVAVPQPAAARPYLSQLGMPHDVLLIKRIAAVGGDKVCRNDAVITTPTRRVEARLRDRRGVELPVWQGCRRLAPGEVFLLGDTASSFDSRYFGAVGGDQIIGVYRETLRW